MNRGRNRAMIFLDDVDALDFLNTVEDTVERFGIEVHAYSLMPYHLLVRSPLGNLSSAMKHLGATYTQCFNRRHRRDGSLFRGRFKSQLVRYEAYLMYLVAYIHLNPLRAGLITRLDGLRGWTSHRRYMGKDQDPEWLSTEVFAGQFESPEEMKTFILKLHQKALPWPEGLNLGDGWFRWHLCPVDVVRKETSDDRETVTVEELVEAICQITGATRERLKESVRGRGGNPERRFAVWALQTSTYMTHREVGGVLGMTLHHVAREARRNKDGIIHFKEWTTEWLGRYPGKVSFV
jgi:putative transposase